MKKLFGMIAVFLIVAGAGCPRDTEVSPIQPEAVAPEVPAELPTPAPAATESPEPGTQVKETSETSTQPTQTEPEQVDEKTDEKISDAQPPEPLSPAALLVNLESGPFFFKPNTIQAKVGQEVTVRVTAKGTHTFTIDELGIDTRTSNETVDITFTPTKAGTFAFYCDIPGHRASGQEGTLVVSN